MEIYWLGHGCFRLRGRDATVLTDPCPPATGYRIGKVNADIVTISRNHPESSYREAVSGNGDAKVLTGPGEYEIAGVLITGIDTDRADRADGFSRNVAYVIDIDDIKICHLGDIARTPTGDEVGELTGVDIMMVPVGGGRVLGAEKAAEIVSLLEPKIVIPMLYKTDAAKGDFEPVDRFVKEMGAEAKSPETRLSITRSGIPQDTTLVLLNYRG
jgi:L-ascorbate metabolism protein UlaG (beta-lactamase superfamily)